MQMIVLIYTEHSKETSHATLGTRCSSRASRPEIFVHGTQAANDDAKHFFFSIVDASTLLVTTVLLQSLSKEAKLREEQQPDRRKLYLAIPSPQSGDKPY